MTSQWSSGDLGQVEVGVIDSRFVPVEEADTAATHPDVAGAGVAVDDAVRAGREGGPGLPAEVDGVIGHGIEVDVSSA